MVLPERRIKTTSRFGGDPVFPSMRDRIQYAQHFADNGKSFSLHRNPPPNQVFPPVNRASLAPGNKKPNQELTMKTIHTTLIGSLAILIAGTAAAQDKPEGDARRGRPQMSPEMREQMLKEFDKDGDGELNEKERTAAREAGRARMEARRAAFMKKWDKDGDGELSDTEREAMKADMEKRRKKMLKKYDKDGDGELNAEERKAMMEAIIKKYDKDGDGKLNAEEREAAADELPPMMGRRRGGPGQGGPQARGQGGQGKGGAKGKGKGKGKGEGAPDA